MERWGMPQCKRWSRRKCDMPQHRRCLSSVQFLSKCKYTIIPAFTFQRKSIIFFFQNSLNFTQIWSIFNGRYAVFGKIVLKCTAELFSFIYFLIFYREKSMQPPIQCRREWHIRPRGSCKALQRNQNCVRSINRPWRDKICSSLYADHWIHTSRLCSNNRYPIHNRFLNSDTYTNVKSIN